MILEKNQEHAKAVDNKIIKIKAKIYEMKTNNTKNQSQRVGS